MLLLSFGFAILAIGVGASYFYLSKHGGDFGKPNKIESQTEQNQVEPLPSITPNPSINQTLLHSPTPTPKPRPSITPTPTPTPTVKFTFHLYEAPTSSCGGYTCIGSNDPNEQPIKHPDSFKLKLQNTKTNQVWQKDSATDWTVEKLLAGSYKATVEYPSATYHGYTSSCDNCQNQQPLSTTGLCGYSFELIIGKDSKMSCGVNNPNEISPDANDHNPPSWNVYYPQANGTITYKTDGKVCVYMYPPSDDRVGDIQGRVGFDGNWQDWKKASSYAYACMDTLTNGSHTFTYQAKDLAGNEQQVQTMNLTVNIEGN